MATLTRYKIKLSNVHTGQSKEVEFAVNWCPTKVSDEEIGRAAAAQHSIEDKLHHQESRYMATGVVMLENDPEFEGIVATITNE